MAANKFASMLHRNTNKMAVILVYTILEWILIALLLLNALFSRLIAGFAAFFGLKPPCLLCSRLDRASYRDLLCDHHAAEVSRLGYCTAHRRLAESGDMCEDCLSSRPPEAGDRSVALLSWMKRVEDGEKDLRCSCCDVVLESGFYSPYLLLKTSSWDVLEYAQNGKLGEEEGSDGQEEEEEGGEEDPGVSLDCGGSRQDDDDDDDDVVGDEQEQVQQEFETDVVDVVENSDTSVMVEEDASLEQISKRILIEEERLVPVELISYAMSMNSHLDSGVSMNNHLNFYQALPVDDDDDGGDDGDDLVEASDSETVPEEKMPLIPSVEIGDRDASLAVEMGDLVDLETVLEEKVSLLSNVEIEDRDSSLAATQMAELVEDYSSPVPPSAGLFSGDCPSDQQKGVPQSIVAFPQQGVHIQMEPSVVARDLVQLEAVQMAEFLEDHSSPGPSAELPSRDCSSDRQLALLQSTLVVSQAGVDVQVESLASAQDFDGLQEEDSKVADVEANCEISIGSEICDQEQINHPTSMEDQWSGGHNETTENDQVTEPEPVEVTNARGLDCSSLRLQLNEVEDDRVLPETPTSIEGIHAFHRRFLIDRRESGTESLDGSVASELDGSETLTVDHLKAALRAERKALTALYVELEEERSASAIAANQTMAMITRLQEEKAAMQMEALQYQRMMEEQSEYDQEALQLLNELMMKREREKQDLEKELELYRKKVLIYEAERRKKAARSSKANSNGRSGTSSASSSAGDSDDLSFEFHESEEFHSYDNRGSYQSTPSDAVLSSMSDQEAAKHLITLDESLADFEEERISILEQLKALEDKLFTMDGEDPKDDRTSMGHHFPDENGDGCNGDYESFAEGGNNGMVNGFGDDLDANVKLQCKPRSVASRGKRLLPLFDAAFSTENEDGVLMPKQEATDGSAESVLKFTMDDHKKIAIAEEVDNVYERLQALEADREFLKHCISSLKKGDKGIDLLQEILQHLRDLRNVELRVRNAGDAVVS